MRRKKRGNGMEGNKESVRGLSASKKQHQRMLRDRIVLLKNIELLRLGYRIRGARKVLGYTQKVFAGKCGLERSYLGGVERGERNIAFCTLCAICDIAAINQMHSSPHAGVH
jgi:DNA-binding XRE family transcriptional regulator